MGQLTTQKNLFNIENFREIASVFVESNYFSGTASAAQAVVKIQAGAEIGLPPFASMQNLHIISGKISMSATLIASLIEESDKYDYKVLESTDKICKIEFFRKKKNAEEFESRGIVTWTIDMAERAKLLKKDNWQNYPEAMLFSRAISQGARQYAPDIFRGSVYAEGELEDSTESFKAEIIQEESIPLKREFDKKFDFEESKPVEEPKFTTPETPTSQAVQEMVTEVKVTMKDEINRLNAAITSVKSLDLLLQVESDWNQIKRDYEDELQQKTIDFIENRILEKKLGLENF